MDVGLSDTCRDIIALSLIPGLGPKRIERLLENGTELEDVFSKSSVKESSEYAEEMEYIKAKGIKAISCGDEGYPEQLKNIYDPPQVLFYKGSLAKSDVNAVDQSRQRISGGLGMRLQDYFWDVALVHDWWDEGYSLYTLQDGFSPGAVISKNITSLVITGGLNF